MSDNGKSIVSHWRKGEMIQNFGDFLSEYLAKYLFYPYRANVRAVHIVGSVIDDIFVSEEGDPVLFWGCGLRQGGVPSEALRRNAYVLSVRGPLSASILAGGELMPFGDPAFLLPALHTPDMMDSFQGKSICIPHFHDNRPDKDLLAMSGCEAILRPNIENSEQSLIELIDAIVSSEFVLSASLHGCVVAAAYGRPFAYWNPGSIDLPFKWEDLSASLSIPCIFAENLHEGRNIFRDEIAPVIKIPDLMPSLLRSPLLIRASAVLKILTWQNRPANGEGVSRLADVFSAITDLEHRQNKIYEGIIAELEYWSKRAIDAEGEVISVKQASDIANPIALEFQGRLDRANAEISKLTAENERVRDELVQLIVSSAKVDGERQALLVWRDQQALDAEGEKAERDALRLRIAAQEVSIDDLRRTNADSEHSARKAALALELDLQLARADLDRRTADLASAFDERATLSNNLARSSADLAAATEKLEQFDNLTAMVSGLKADLEQKSAEVVAQSNEIHLGEARLALLRSQYDEEVARAAYFESDSQRLGGTRHAEGEKGSETNMSDDWARKIQVQLIDSPWWWGLLPRPLQRARLHDRLKRKGLFDAGAYLTRYPDVALNGMDPLRHYILYGRAEGRQIAPLVPLGVPHVAQPMSASDAPRRMKEYPEVPIHHDAMRIMIVDGTYPTPDRDSGSVDAVNFIKIFKDLGYSVYFMATANFRRAELDDVAVKARADLEAMDVVIVDDKYGPDIGEIIRLKGGYFGLFFLSRIYAGGIFFEAVRTHAPESRIIFNTVDLHGVRELREGTLEGNRVKIMGAYRTTEREHYLARLSDATIVVSAEEAKLLASALPGANIFEVPLLRDIPGTSVDTLGRSGLGFIGGYKHVPNIDAINYFLAEIWPLIRAELPDARFHMMGADMPDELKMRTDPGLVVVGQVEDLQAAFDSLRLTVAPLRFGAGAKGKVVSSLSHGLPCVGTSIAAEGMGLDGGVLMADTPEEFAKEVVRICRDDDLWRSLSEKGLALMNRRYSLAAGSGLVKQLLQSVGQKI